MRNLARVWGGVWAAALLVTGCQSYEIVQSNIFSDDDGYLVRIDYGRSDSDHENEFRNPMNGKVMTYQSKLVVDVELPDGDTFTAWQCMNFMRSGTMYKTDNEKWQILVNGFSCIIYRQIQKEPLRYKEVYRGILCESPKTDYEADPKWRTLKKNAAGEWK